MCPEQLAYFYNILNTQKEELLSDSDSVLSAVRMAEKTEIAGVGDETDNATYNQDITMDLRMSDRSNKLLQKVNAALDHRFLPANSGRPQILLVGGYAHILT